MRELGIFAVIFAVLVTLLAGVVRLLGGSFGLNFGEAWFLSLFALVFVAPAIMNIHIFASPNSDESAMQRILALIRAIGMLLSASACALPIVSTIRNPPLVLSAILVGLFMNFGTLPLEYLLNRKSIIKPNK